MEEKFGKEDRELLIINIFPCQVVSSLGYSFQDWREEAQMRWCIERPFAKDEVPSTCTKGPS